MDGAEAAEACGPFTAQFKQFALELDATNEKRERIVKASRDTTYQSKKVIFELHRATKQTRDRVVAKASADAKKVRGVIASRIATELSDDEYPRFHRAFSPGIQEYVEAVLFLGYLESATLLSPQQVEAQIAEACRESDVPFIMRLDLGDYILGIADLTGELMRLAIGSVANGDLETPFTVRKFMNQIESFMDPIALSSGGAMGRELSSKMRVLKQSVGKVERTCFDVTVRHSEFGDAVPASALLRTRLGDERGSERPAKRLRGNSAIDAGDAA